MSGTAIIQYLLKQNAGLIAAVPATRIKINNIPLNTAYPAIAISKISAVQSNPLAMIETTRFVRERVQVTVDYKIGVARVDVLALVRAALPNQHGTVNGYALEAILPDTEGPELEDLETQIVSTSQDFIVCFNRAA